MLLLILLLLSPIGWALGFIMYLGAALMLQLLLEGHVLFYTMSFVVLLMLCLLLDPREREGFRELFRSRRD